MHLATISPLPYTRHAARDARLFDGERMLATDSDGAGLFDLDAVTDRGDLHRLFEGAVVIAELDDYLDEPTIGFDD
ncbi:MAG: hypothetical protein HS128_17145 [Ideonella sp.]|nr:hypothetical protein [Ideonella sp.]MCC7458759.1 hypothetical protein [Nitrospira sp.]